MPPQLAQVLNQATVLARLLHTVGVALSDHLGKNICQKEKSQNKKGHRVSPKYFGTPKKYTRNLVQDMKKLPADDRIAMERRL